MAKVFCGINIPEEADEFSFTPIHLAVFSSVETRKDTSGNIVEVDYYHLDNILKKVKYADGSVSEVIYFREGNLEKKQLYEEGRLNKEYVYKTNGEVLYLLEYEYNLNKLFSITQTFGLNSRKVEFGYDFMGRITERKIYSDDNPVLNQKYFFDALDRVSGYEDDYFSFMVGKFTQNNQLQTYRITDKMKNEVIVTNNFEDKNYIDTEISVNGSKKNVKDTSYLENIIMKKPTKNMEELDLIISKLYDNKEQEYSMATRRPSATSEERLESNLVNIIEYKTKSKPLPISLRKRALYQQYLESHG